MRKKKYYKTEWLKGLKDYNNHLSKHLEKLKRIKIEDDGNVIYVDENNRVFYWKEFDYPLALSRPFNLRWGIWIPMTKEEIKKYKLYQKANKLQEN